MYSDDENLPFLAVFFGCTLAILFALFTFYCLHFMHQVRKKKSRFYFRNRARQNFNHFRQANNGKYCEYCNFYKENQIQCDCILSNNNSNSLINNDQEVDFKTLTEKNLEKVKEHLLNVISEDRIVNLDQTLNQEDDFSKLKQLINDNSNNETDLKSKLNNIFNQDQDSNNKSNNNLTDEIKSKNCELNDLDASKKTPQKLKRKSIFISHSESLEQVKNCFKNESGRIIRIASLNASLVRQKSFDLTEEDITYQDDSSLSKYSDKQGDKHNNKPNDDKNKQAENINYFSKNKLSKNKNIIIQSFNNLNDLSDNNFNLPYQSKNRFINENLITEQLRLSKKDSGYKSLDVRDFSVEYDGERRLSTISSNSLNWMNFNFKYIPTSKSNELDVNCIKKKFLSINENEEESNQNISYV